jgi:hypothetical protein
MLRGGGDVCYRENETDVTGRMRRMLQGEGYGCYREKETDVTGRRRRMLLGAGDGSYGETDVTQAASWFKVKGSLRREKQMAA